MVLPPYMIELAHGWRRVRTFKLFGSNQEVEEVEEVIVVVEDLVLRDFLLDLDVFFEVDLDRFVELIVVFSLL